MSVLKKDDPAVYDHGGDDFIYTKWAAIDYLELLQLLQRKLADWRRVVRGHLLSDDTSIIYRHYSIYRLRKRFRQTLPFETTLRRSG